jgi:AcrR family transcriptional regulator
MPKIIPDLGPRILRAAAHQFEAKGFAATDMKSLATEVGISVGTLYNYYPSKPELFLAVSLLWKDELSARMLARLDEADTPVAKLRTVLQMLYDDMENFTGLWREFIRSGTGGGPGSPHAERFRKDNDALHQRLQDLLRDVWKGHPNSQRLLDDDGNRLARLMVTSVLQLAMGAGDDKPANRRFVEAWIDFVAPLP